jgi:hypothetical protein
MPLWVIICGLGITQIIGWGTTYYALGALSQDISAATGWSQTLIFGAFSAALLLSGLISPITGRLTDRIGGRPVMITGSLLAAAGLAVIGLIPSPVTYVAGWLLLGLAMRLATYDAAFASLTQIVGVGARRAISYLTLFGGLASTVFWPLSHYLSLAIGWSDTFLVFAALHLVVCLPLHWFILRGARGDTHHTSGAADAPFQTPGRRKRQLIMLFATAVALNGLVFSAISAHVVPLFDQLGFEGETAVVLAALIGPAQVAARLGDILLGRQASPLSLGLTAFGLLPVAIGIFALLQFSWVGALAFALLYGASNGLVTIAKGAVPLMLFGPRGYGEILGLVATPNLILNAAAPLLMSLLLDVASPEASMLAAGLAALGSCLCMLALRRVARG